MSARLLLRLINIVGATLILSAIGAAVAFLWYDRQAVWTHAADSLADEAASLAMDISRMVHVYDLTLRGVMEELADPRLGRLGPDVGHKLLFDRSTMADYLGSILVLDAKGVIVHDSRITAPDRRNFADRDYFQVHRQRGDAGLYVSSPYLSRLRSGDPSIAVSRRLSGPDGAFAGVVMGALRLAYFEDRFGQMPLKPDDVIVLARADGVVLTARTGGGPLPRPVDPSGQAARHVPPSGHFLSAGYEDGIRRYHAYAHVGTAPLVVTIARPSDDILRPWTTHAWFIGCSTLAFCAVALPLMAFFRQQVKRGSFQRAQLAVLASTDGLTGLLNRRAFDLALNHALSEAMAHDQPLALLFIDADHFKRFNDLYGHPAGDALLRRLAGIIAQAARRPGDLAARYGGEEFVLLLADTGRQAALQRGEALRLAVEQLAIPNGDGIATVSVGVASMLVRPAQSCAWLVAQADEAMYQAKSKGRNRVEAAPASAA